MCQRTIESNGNRLAIYIPASVWGKGLNFLSSDQDSIQVGIWGYDRGKKLEPHIHNEVPRRIVRTQELVLVKTGRMATVIFDQDGGFVERIELGPGDALILLEGGHGYEILEDDTSVLEVKNGPYLGAEVDRRRIEWKN